LRTRRLPQCLVGADRNLLVGLLTGGLVGMLLGLLIGLLLGLLIRGRSAGTLLFGRSGFGRTGLWFRRIDKFRMGPAATTTEPLAAVPPVGPAVPIGCGTIGPTSTTVIAPRLLVGLVVLLGGRPGPAGPRPRLHRRNRLAVQPVRPAAERLELLPLDSRHRLIRTISAPAHPARPAVTIGSRMTRPAAVTELGLIVGVMLRLRRRPGPAGPRPRLHRRNRLATQPVPLATERLELLLLGDRRQVIRTIHTVVTSSRTGRQPAIRRSGFVYLPVTLIARIERAWRILPGRARAC
jgi:hypothetical protein